MSKILARFFSIFLLISSPLCADSISSAQKVYADVNSSVFTILIVNKSNQKKAIGYGSAVAITRKWLATNCHVLKGDIQLIKIEKELLPGVLIGKDPVNDLCILEVMGKHFNPVKLRASKTVKIGEEVYTIGTPKGYEKSISRGIISNEIKYKNTVVLQTDAAISPGSSGGGLFDTRGHLIGMTFLKDEGTATEGIGFAIPTEVISSFIKTYSTESATVNT